MTAFLTVQEGCDKFCTFCVVPYTRGSEVSRPVSQIVAEAERLADAGVREVTLLGQNVNAWHGEGPDGSEWGLGRLLFRLAEIPGLARLRYTTSHPRDMDDELIAAHRDLPALMPYLHLPVQSGSDRILKAMNRRHTAADYLRLIERIRAVRAGHRHVGRLHRRLSGRDGCRFRGDDADRAAMSLRLGVLVQIFAASRHARRGDGRIMCRKTVKNERLQRLQALLAEQQSAFVECAGRQDHFDALIEKPGRQAGQIVGRSPWLQPVIVDEKAGRDRRHYRCANHEGRPTTACLAKRPEPAERRDV